MKIISVIPARSGSKGVKDKNIKMLAGHPLLAYSIKAGCSVKKVDRVICSTDSEKIAEIAVRYGAEIPFLRPASLAQDNTPDFPVFRHLLKYLRQKEGYYPDIIIHLRPTSPVRYTRDINKAITVFERTPAADSLRTVCLAPITPFKMWEIKRSFLIPLLKIKGIAEPYNMPRQKLPQIYWQTGYVDIIRTSTLDAGSMTGAKILPFVINNDYIIDIDSELQFKRAAELLNKLKCIKP